MWSLASYHLTFISRSLLCAHTRLKHLNILDWQGKGPGSRGRPGHILRVETKLNNTGVNYQLTDAMPNTTMWENLYLVDENMDGNDITE